jgi:hypothetical protein
MADDKKSDSKDPANVDDWFDLDKYKEAAGVAYEYSKKKIEDTGEQTRKIASQSQEFSERDEARDYDQAQKARRF